MAGCDLAVMLLVQTVPKAPSTSSRRYLDPPNPSHFGPSEGILDTFSEGPWSPKECVLFGTRIHVIDLAFDLLSDDFAAEGAHAREGACDRFLALMLRLLGILDDVPVVLATVLLKNGESL